MLRKSYSLFLSLLLLFLAMAFLGLGFVSAQNPPNTPLSNLVPTATIIPTPVTTGNSPSSTLTYEQAINYYSEIPTSTEKTVEFARQTVEFAQWILGTVLTVSGILTAAAIYIANQSRKAQNAAMLSSNLAERSAEESEKSRIRVEELEVQIGTAASSLKEEGDAIKRQLKYMQNLNILLETLAMLRRHEIKLFSDKDDKQLTIVEILEYSRDPDPVVRFECLRILGKISEYPELEISLNNATVKRLNELALSDEENLIRLEAQKVLNQITS